MRNYIGIFQGIASAQLQILRNALAQADGELIFKSLHILKPHLHLFGIKNAYGAVVNVEAVLQKNREVTIGVRNSVSFISEEITLACIELQAIQGQYG